MNLSAEIGELPGSKYVYDTTSLSLSKGATSGLSKSHIDTLNTSIDESLTSINKMYQDLRGKISHLDSATAHNPSPERRPPAHSPGKRPSTQSESHDPTAREEQVSRRVDMALRLLEQRGVSSPPKHQSTTSTPSARQRSPPRPKLPGPAAMLNGASPGEIDQSFSAFHQQHRGPLSSSHDRSQFQGARDRQRQGDYHRSRGIPTSIHDETNDGHNDDDLFDVTAIRKGSDATSISAAMSSDTIGDTVDVENHLAVVEALGQEAMTTGEHLIQLTQQNVTRATQVLADIKQAETDSLRKQVHTLRDKCEISLKELEARFQTEAERLRQACERDISSSRDQCQRTIAEKAKRVVAQLEEANRTFQPFDPLVPRVSPNRSGPNVDMSPSALSQRGNFVIPPSVRSSSRRPSPPPSSFRRSNTSLAASHAFGSPTRTTRTPVSHRDKIAHFARYIESRKGRATAKRSAVKTTRRRSFGRRRIDVLSSDSS